MLDNEPAELMSVDDWNRHMAQTCTIRVHEPTLPLTQGSWLRCSRRNVNATLNTLISSIKVGERLRVTVSDGLRASDLRRQSLARKEGQRGE